MANEGLQRPCIDSAGCQGVASSMPQHVSMDREWQLSGLAKPFYELLSAINRKWRWNTNVARSTGIDAGQRPYETPSRQRHASARRQRRAATRDWIGRASETGGDALGLPVLISTIAGMVVMVPIKVKSDSAKSPTPASLPEVPRAT